MFDPGWLRSLFFLLLVRESRGPTAAFDQCINGGTQLSTSGAPVANGNNESIVDQGVGVVGQVWAFGSHADAEQNARVMTGYPVRVVRGSYMVEVNQNAPTTDSNTIQGCAADISAGPASTQPAAANTASAPAVAQASTVTSTTDTGGQCGPIPSNQSWTITSQGASCLTALHVMGVLAGGGGVLHVGSDMSTTYTEIDGWSCQGPKLMTAGCQKAGASLSATIASSSAG